MREVTKDEFDAFMLNHNCTVEYEKDIEYAYDSYTADGEEIGFISYHSHKPTTYHIAAEPIGGIPET